MEPLILALTKLSLLLGVLAAQAAEVPIDVLYKPDASVFDFQLEKGNGRVRDRIVQKAKEYGVDPFLALSIAKCESGFDVYAKNPHSSAQSVFQFIDSTWEQTLKDTGLPSTIKKTDLPYAVDLGVWLLAKDGSRHWDSSRSCWGK